jgi:hypothetical protein
MHYNKWEVPSFPSLKATRKTARFFISLQMILLHGLWTVALIKPPAKNACSAVKYGNMYMDRRFL